MIGMRVTTTNATVQTAKPEFTPALALEVLAVVLARQAPRATELHKHSHDATNQQQLLTTPNFKNSPSHRRGAKTGQNETDT